MLVTYPDVAYLSGCVLVAGSPSPLRGRDRGSSSVTVTHALTLSFTWTELERSGPRGRSQAWFLDNVARNSPAASSNFEFASLELQRFERRLKTDRGKLCATFYSARPCGAAGPADALHTGDAWCMFPRQVLRSLPYPLGLSG